MSTAATPKDQLRRVIEDQPDDSSFEEIIKELAFTAMVEPWPRRFKGRPNDQP